MANQKTEQKHQDWKLAFCLNSLYVAILVPGQHRVLRFNGVQVKPQLCTWEQSCAAHCCCVERWGGNCRRAGWSLTQEVLQGKPKGPFKESFMAEAPITALTWWIVCWSVLLFLTFSIPGEAEDVFPSQLCQNVPLKVFSLLSLPCFLYTC